MNYKKKSEKAITLIALVVTIILLIILAGVAINLILGENGLLSRTKYAKQEYEIAQEKEKLDIKIADVQAQKEGNATINDVIEALKNETNVNYYVAGNKIATITTIGTISNEPKELYVVCNNKYQFKLEENLKTSFISIVDIEKIGETIPPATKDTETGTKVQLPDKWKTQTEEGEDTGIYAISVGGTTVVPIPKDFYYVGGNLDTGVIISDNENDRYKYNPETKKEDDKTLDKTTYEYTTKLKGNQFVWIPCEIEEYQKCDTWNEVKQTNGTLANANWNTTTPDEEKAQIEKYGGFYVARYEAGLANTIEETIENQKHTGSNQIYNKAGIPQSKAGIVPWMFIDWTHAKANAESMYKKDYLSSGLITGTQWDVMLKKMIGKTIGENKSILTESNLVDSTDWGNYMNNSIHYVGRLAKCDYNSTNSNVWTLKSFGTKTTGTTNNYSSNNGDLLTTGASKTAQVYHIYDAAGNLWEWTEEISYNTTGEEYRMCRSGGFLSNTNKYSACFRDGGGRIEKTGVGTGFRTVLYIK